MDQNPHSNAHFFFDNSAKKTYNGEKTAPSTNVPGKSGYPSAKN
jgi:hypothetical protein